MRSFVLSISLTCLLLTKLAYSCELKILDSISLENTLSSSLFINQQDNSSQQMIPPTSLNEAFEHIRDNYYFDAIDSQYLDHQESYILLGTKKNYKRKRIGVILDENLNPIFKRDIHNLYNQLAKRSKIRKSNLKIQGLSSNKLNTYLFVTNKKTNVLFKIPTDEFHDYMKKEIDDISSITPYYIKLPVNNGKEAMISSADFGPKKEILYITAHSLTKNKKGINL